jgi:hypothetical protein
MAIAAASFAIRQVPTVQLFSTRIRIQNAHFLQIESGLGNGVEYCPLFDMNPLSFGDNGTTIGQGPCVIYS